MRAHEESVTCWCVPRVFVYCYECHDGCWKCDGGKIWLSAHDALAESERTLVVVHNDGTPELPPSAQGNIGIGQRHHREPDSGQPAGEENA